MIRLKNISKSFDDKKVLSDINVEFASGKTNLVIGQSGSGKTVLIKSMVGLFEIDEGEITYNDRNFTKMNFRDKKSIRKEIGMVFQKPNLMPWRTVLENVMLPLQIRGLPINTQKQNARDILQIVGLGDFTDHYPKTLSGGMEQRVVLARALVTHPEILLLDEPFAALDSLTREKLNLELLKLWRERHLTAIMVTHNIREAVFFSDRVLVLSPRPATIAKEFIIDLPRPRDEKIEYTSTFVDLSYEIRKSIKA